MSEPLHVAYGAIEGRVSTAAGQRFFIREPVHNRAVMCHLPDGYDRSQIVRGARVMVAGLIERHPITGTPVNIQVDTVTIVRRSFDYLQARGVLPALPGDPLPEDVIRRLRDDW